MKGSEKIPKIFACGALKMKELIILYDFLAADPKFLYIEKRQKITLVWSSASVGASDGATDGWFEGINVST